MSQELIDRAADLIAQRGWVQRRPGSEFPHRLCIVTALRAARYEDEKFTVEEERSALDLLYSRLADLGEARCGIGWWNDRPGRTVDEVLDFMRLQRQRRSPLVGAPAIETARASGRCGSADTSSAIAATTRPTRAPSPVVSSPPFEGGEG